MCEDMESQTGNVGHKFVLPHLEEDYLVEPRGRIISQHTPNRALKSGSSSHMRKSKLLACREYTCSKELVRNADDDPPTMEDLSFGNHLIVYDSLPLSEKSTC